MNCAIYARYSTHEQDSSTTIESQIRECEQYIAKQGWVVNPRHIYVDRAVSGSSITERPAFQSMIVQAQKNPSPFQAIVVWKFSRFARNREDSAIYKGLLRRHGVDVISVSEPVDKNSASGILTEGMYEVIDQFYSARLAEDTHRGMEQTALEGFTCGGTPPYGYRRKELLDPSGKTDSKGNRIRKVTWEIDKTQATVVRRIFQRYVEGTGFKRIAVELNNKGIPAPRSGSWDPSCIRAILRNEAYLGWRVWNKTQKFRLPSGKRSKRMRPLEEWIIKKEAHPPIVDKRLWNKALERRQYVRDTYGDSMGGISKIKAEYSPYLLSGLIRCGTCGAKYVMMKSTSGGREYYRYGCGYNKRRGTAVCSNSFRLPRDSIEHEVINLFKRKLLQPQTIEDLVRRTNEKITRMVTEANKESEVLESNLKTIQAKIDKLLDALEDGRLQFPSIRNRLADYERQQENIKAELDRLTQARQARLVTVSRKVVEDKIGEMGKLLSHGDPQKIKRELRRNILEIVVYPTKRIELKINPEGLLDKISSVVPIEGAGRGI